MWLLFAGCSSKLSCDDSDVVMLAKDILFENHHNTLVNINWKFISDHGKELMALKDNDFTLDVYAIYKNAFEYFNIGKASAIAYVLFVIILVLTLFQWKFRKKIVYNEE